MMYHSLLRASQSRSPHLNRSKANNCAVKRHQTQGRERKNYLATFRAWTQSSLEVSIKIYKLETMTTLSSCNKLTFSNLKVLSTRGRRTQQTFTKPTFISTKQRNGFNEIQIDRYNSKLKDPTHTVPYRLILLLSERRSMVSIQNILI